MAKNRIKMNAELFMRVIDALEHLKPGSRQLSSGDRFISLSNDTEGADKERQYLGSITVERFFVDSHIKWLKVDSSDGRKILFSGPRLDLSATLDVRYAKASEFLFFSDYFGMHPSAGSELIHEILDTGHMGVDGYKGHDHRQVMTLFRPVYVVESGALLDGCVSRVVTELFIANGQTHFGIHNIEFFRRVRNCEWNSCDFEQSKMLSALHVSGPLHFLTLYWLLESFFFEAAAKALYIQSRPSIPEDEFYRAMESQIDWRPKEIFAFERLVTDVSSVDDLRRIFQSLNGAEASATADKSHLAAVLAKDIYRFRNSIVHTRHKREKPSSGDMQVYTCALYDIIELMFRVRSPSGETGCRCGDCID